MGGIFTSDHTIERPSRTRGADGSLPETLETVATNVRGRLQPASGREQFIGQRPDEGTQWNFACDLGTDVQKDDIVSRGSVRVVIDAVMPSATTRRVVCVGHQYK